MEKSVVLQSFASFVDTVTLKAQTWPNASALRLQPPRRPPAPPGLGVTALAGRGD